MAADVNYRKLFVQQMARVQNAAARCGWSKGRQSAESLRTALARAEEALAALQICGGPDPEDLSEARERSGLDGWAAARMAHQLVEAGLSTEAYRLAELALLLDPEHKGIASAVTIAKEDSTLFVERLSAIVDDCTRTARARLHASWWLATLAHVAVGHGRLLDMLDAALNAQDWLGSELAMRAIRSHLEQRRLSINTLPGAVNLTTLWPLAKRPPSEELYEDSYTWRTDYGPESRPVMEEWGSGH